MKILGTDDLPTEPETKPVVTPEPDKETQE
jgi:hypothetical protein